MTEADPAIICRLPRFSCSGVILAVLGLGGFGQLSRQLRAAPWLSVNGTHHDGLAQVVLHPLRLVFQEVNVGNHNSTDELDIKPWSGASFESQQPSDRIAIIANTLHFRYLELNVPWKSLLSSSPFYLWRHVFLRSARASSPLNSNMPSTSIESNHSRSKTHPSHKDWYILFFFVMASYFFADVI